LTQLDLVLRGGRVIDPSQDIDSVSDVGFQDGRVAEIDYVDVVGERMTGDWRLEPRNIVLNGQLWNR
jgi:dihydroorotase